MKKYLLLRVWLFSAVAGNFIQVECAEGSRVQRGQWQQQTANSNKNKAAATLTKQQPLQATKLQALLEQNKTQTIITYAWDRKRRERQKKRGCSKKRRRLRQINDRNMPEKVEKSTDNSQTNALHRGWAMKCICVSVSRICICICICSWATEKLLPRSCYEKLLCIFHGPRRASAIASTSALTHATCSDLRGIAELPQQHISPNKLLV